MTMAKNKKKKMSPETKDNLKNIFGSLVSNKRVIDGARHNPWWVAIIFFVLAVLLPIIPILTTGFNAYGSSIFASNTFGMDTQITDFALTLEDDEIKLMVEDGKLNDVDGKWNAKFGYGDNIQYAYTNKNSSQYDLLVYYTDATNDKLTTFVNHIVEKSYVVGSTTVYQAPTSSEASSEQVSVYKPNIMVLNPDIMYIILHKTNSITSVGTVYGDYSSFANGTCLRLELRGNGFNPANYNHESLLNDASYCASTFTKYKAFVDTSFLNNRNRSTLYTTLLAAGIYTALGIFMGLMVFILTRGKRNYYNVLSFIDCEKINAWAMLSPGLLGMILGFMVPGYAIMFFIIFVGLRVMWMSMKQLRPTY